MGLDRAFHPTPIVTESYFSEPVLIQKDSPLGKDPRVFFFFFNKLNDLFMCISS